MSDSAKKNTPERLSIVSNGPKTDEPDDEEFYNRIIKKCGIHGDYKAKHLITIAGRNLFTTCPECEKDYELECKTGEEERKKSEYYERIHRCGIPKRFLFSSFDTIKTNKENQSAIKIIKAYADRFENMLEKGTSLIFCGKPGTGKTMIACAVLLSVMERDMWCRFTTSYKMISEVKQTYNKNSDKQEYEVVNSFIWSPLLVIDEVGVQFGSETEKLIFYQILNGRYEDLKPTILISNLIESELTEFIGERAIDRMKDNGGAIIPFTWNSFRK